MNEAKRGAVDIMQEQYIEDSKLPDAGSGSVLDGLTEVYTRWNKANGLSLGSADEHLHDKSLTKAQRDWLWAFFVIWEETEAALAMAEMAKFAEEGKR